MDDLIDIRAELFAPKEPATVKQGQHHLGFKEKLIASAGNNKGLAYLKRIPESDYFADVEAALNNIGRGKGSGVYIDHDKLIGAIQNAYGKAKDKKTYLSLKDKTRDLDVALRKARALRDSIEAIDKRLFNEYASISGLEGKLMNKIEVIRAEHELSVSRSINKNEGLTKEQIVFCRWLYVFLTIDYPGKLSSALIASVANCIFRGADYLDAEQVKNNLKNARCKLNKLSDSLKRSKFNISLTPVKL